MPAGFDFYLLDTNFFQAACTSPKGAFLRNAIASLKAVGLSFGQAQGTAFRISPFLVMEGLGVVAPTLPRPTVSFSARDPKEVYRQIFEYACDCFSKSPELGIERLRAKRAEKLQYLEPEARELFGMCVSSVIDRQGDFGVILSTFLAQDYFLKYQLPKEVFLAMGEFFGALFYVDMPELSPVSRFRLSMRMHDYLRSDVESQLGYEEVAPAFKIKSSRDMLDTEIIQDVTFGYPYDGGRRRVVVLTLDSAKYVMERAIFHRQVGAKWAGKYVSADYMRQVVKPFQAHPGGVVVQFDRNGSILEAIDLAPIFSRQSHDSS